MNAIFTKVRVINPLHTKLLTADLTKFGEISLSLRFEVRHYERSRAHSRHQLRHS